MKWFTGSGNEINKEDIMKCVKEHTKKNGKVYIGSDSFLWKKFCVMSSVICLHGAENEKGGGNYFFTRSNYKRTDFPNLNLRITQEASESIALALEITEHIPDARVEVHLDINPDKRAATNKLVDNLTGYVKASGLDCKIKPDAWAASAIADKHSK